MAKLEIHQAGSVSVSLSIAWACAATIASVEKMLKSKSTAAFPVAVRGAEKKTSAVANFHWSCSTDRFPDAKTLGSTSAEELWKKAADEAEPRPLKIRYSIEHENEAEETTFEHVVETVFEDPNEAAERPRLLVPLHSVLGLKALCEREFIRTEAVTEMLNQCRTAYYKELLYLREQLILAAEPEKQMMLGAVQNYEVYFFNPPGYVDEDLKEYMLNCSRWTHKKLIEENYELQMKLSGAPWNAMERDKMMSSTMQIFVSRVF